MARLVKGYYKNNELYEYGSKLYTTMGQNVNGTLTQKAFTEAVASIIDDILGINNN